MEVDIIMERNFLREIQRVFEANNIYYETLAGVKRYLDDKYDMDFDLPVVNYETTETIMQDNIRVSIYRMPSGRYEVTDYKMHNKRKQIDSE